jgi:hypothetical protein
VCEFRCCLLFGGGPFTTIFISLPPSLTHSLTQSCAGGSPTSRVCACCWRGAWRCYSSTPSSDPRPGEPLTHSLTHALSYLHTHSLFHAHTRTYTHSLNHYITISLYHYITHLHTHLHTQSFIQSLTHARSLICYSLTH